jgi:hypothetical protein
VSTTKFFCDSLPSVALVPIGELTKRARVEFLLVPALAMKPIGPEGDIG